ncbi:hypothetical protein [Naasia sp. SYSU D00948]|uniref:DUF6630 family protein n=1 Tax=Naasia sp. SYSU D00948 TaxID=2817379 RepID=UPI001B30CCD0|nr:hypothetical protein [Naasia sp. SYSU D00948]
MNRIEAWERLCALLEDDPLLWERVRYALADRDDDPWEELLDGLDDAGALAYLRTDDTGTELADALVQLPRVFRLQLDLDEVNDTDDLADAMTIADEALARAGFRLVLLPSDDDDAHSLVVVPAQVTAELARVAAALRRTVEIGGPGGA